ncbi:MAG: sigma-70 family RNA polymerase sigma factor [Myxococcota bacterium]
MSGPLWQAFVAALPAGHTRAGASDAPTTEALLADLLERGDKAWPELTVAPEAFVAAIARALVDEGSVDAALEEVRAEELYLTCACAGGDERAVAAFQRQFAPVIDRTLAGSKTEATVVDEVRQAVWVRLFVDEGERRAKIGLYAGRGALGNWLRVVTARTRADVVRKIAGRRAREAEREDAEALDPVASSPELRHLEATYRDEFRQAFALAIEQLEPPARNLLRQRIVYGLQIEQIAALFKIHPATVKRRLARTRLQLRDDTQRFLVDQLRVDDSDLASILRVIQSRMDVSVRRLLASDG